MIGVYRRTVHNDRDVFFRPLTSPQLKWLTRTAQLPFARLAKLTSLEEEVNQRKWHLLLNIRGEIDQAC